MLTIENHYRLCDKPIENTGFKIGYCWEHDDWYEIGFKNQRTSRVTVKVRLSRKPEKLHDGRTVYRFLKESGETTPLGVTADWIKDMNNLLKKLKGFVKI